MNPRAGFPTYTLSRGASSPLEYFSVIGEFPFHHSVVIKMAERVGFEPTVPCGITGFQDQLFKPLRHLSKQLFTDTIKLYHILFDLSSIFLPYFSLFSACLENGNMHKCEGFFRQARRFSAGILDVFQGKSTQHDGKRPAFWACCPFFKHALVALLVL